MKESELTKQLQLLASELGARLFRNNVGVLEDKRGNYVKYGLCVGSSDLIGWRSVEIKPEDVGKKVAVFFAVEVKMKKKKATKEQAAFIEAVRKSGGIAFVVRTKEELHKILED